jgi:hypothetical protein
MNTPGETTRSLGSIFALYRILQAFHTLMRDTESYNLATAYFLMLFELTRSGCTTAPASSIKQPHISGLMSISKA